MTVHVVLQDPNDVVLVHGDDGRPVGVRDALESEEAGPELLRELSRSGKCQRFGSRDTVNDRNDAIDVARTGATNREHMPLSRRNARPTRRRACSRMVWVSPIHRWDGVPGECRVTATAVIAGTDCRCASPDRADVGCANGAALLVVPCSVA